MKAKKWLTIITFVISLISLVSAFAIGKDGNCIFYDISMAFLGSAFLGFIMSLTEYFVEKRKAMEEFWLQATSVLKRLRKINYLEVDAPYDLIIDAFTEERSNEWHKIIAALSEDKEVHHEAKDKLLSWYEESAVLTFDENTDVDRELDTIYEYEIKKYKEVFIRCMDSYRLASSVGLGAFDNAYGNLDFLVGNKHIRQKVCDPIYNKLRDIVNEFRTEASHFSLLKSGKDTLPACASKVRALNQKYFLQERKKLLGIQTPWYFRVYLMILMHHWRSSGARFMELNTLNPKESRFLAKCFILMKMGKKCPVESPEKLGQIQSLPKPQIYSPLRKRITPVHASANHARHARFRVTLCGSAWSFSFP